jgi:hypothetical protein
MNTITASSFADMADVARYQHAKAMGWSDARAFKVGDNGIGFTGHLCATETENCCALPWEIWMGKWGDKAHAAGRGVSVTYNGKTVHGRMWDTMPHLAQITNGAGIDLNPGFAKAFGVKPPFMLHGVTWEWID